MTQEKIHDLMFDEIVDLKKKKTGNCAQMRDYVANKYPSKTWKDKVAKMTDVQIVAV